MSLKFKFNNNEPSDRYAFRLAVPGLVAKLSGFDGAFPLLDISAGGLAIKADRTDNMRPGQETVIEIMSVSQKKILRCSARLVRVSQHNGAVAFEFINLNAFQEASLDKLVLEVQKREIERQKYLAGEGQPKEEA